MKFFFCFLLLTLSSVFFLRGDPLSDMVKSGFTVKLPDGWKTDQKAMKKAVPDTASGAVYFAVFEKEKYKETPLTFSVFRVPSTGNFHFEEKAAHDAYLKRKDMLYCLKRNRVKIGKYDAMESIYRMRNNIFASIWSISTGNEYWTLVFLYASDANHDDMKKIQACAESFRKTANE